MKIEITPLRPDAPKNIQWVFGYKIYWMGQWRIALGIHKDEIEKKLLRKIGAA